MQLTLTHRPGQLMIALVLCLVGFTGPTTAALRPEPGAAVGTWYTVREWVNTLTVPSVDDDTQAVQDANASCYCMILRFQGRTVGIGTATRADKRMLHAAAERALQSALNHRTIASLPPDIQKDAGLQLTVELEVGGTMEPLVGETFREYETDIHPIHDGIALRWDDEWVYRFPSKLRLANEHAQSSLFDAMTLSMDRSLLNIHNALLKGDVTAYRFPVLDIGQATPTSAPMEIIGGLLGGAPPLTTSNLHFAHSALVDHITQSIWPGDESLGLMGTYEPATDRFDPLIAAPSDQAMLAFSLAEAAHGGALDAERSDTAAETAALILSVLAAKDLQMHDTTAASVVLTMDALPDLVPTDSIVAAHEHALDQLHILADLPASNVNATDAHALAIAAYALARHGSREASRRLADRAWAALPMERHSTLFPWIAWCELELAEDGAIAHRDQLLAVRNLLHQRQVPPADTHFGMELTGGYVFGRNPTDVTSQSLRPGAAIPAMLQSIDLTAPEQVNNEWNRVRAFTGFLLQLQISPTGATLHPNASRSTGGVRRSPWDARMQPAAQAMALLTLQELLDLDSAYLNSTDK